MHVISQLNERYQPAPQTGGSFELSMFTMHTFRKWKSRHNHKCKICNGIKPLKLNYGCAQLIFFIVVSLFLKARPLVTVSVYISNTGTFLNIFMYLSNTNRPIHLHVHGMKCFHTTEICVGIAYKGM